MWVGAAVLAVLTAGGGAWALGAFDGSCGATLRITVAAQPEIAPALREAAANFTVEKHRVRGRCVQAAVTPVAPADYVRDAARREIGDAWVPESALWLGVARDRGVRSVPDRAPSIAASPVVLAAPRAADPGEQSWQALRDTGHSRRADGMSGTVALIALGQIDSADDDLVKDLRKGPALAGLTAVERSADPIVVTTEQAVVAYNDTHRPNPAAALVPREGTLLLDHPFAVTTADPGRRDAAQAFLTALGTRSARDILQRAGFRTVQGTFAPEYAQRFGLTERPPRALRPPELKEIRQALKAWG
ncbi:hypothetical protein ACRB68_52440 [Actinomadura sp. RB68]|uniref:ABC transporter substrate-binding protein n=2 Tax=Actinomadura macrotermitis TaxID=2585200 RepID=A0A7K0C0Z6_9ACTN|nr:hypothetical protein [Actinomadura macrotermitis]